MKPTAQQFAVLINEILRIQKDASAAANLTPRAAVGPFKDAAKAIIDAAQRFIDEHGGTK